MYKYLNEFFRCGTIRFEVHVRCVETSLCEVHGATFYRLPTSKFKNTKCPAQLKHMLPPLPSLPSPSAASSPEKKLPQPHNKAAQSLLLKWRHSCLWRVQWKDSGGVGWLSPHWWTSEPQPPWINNGRQSNLGRERVADRHHECCWNDACRLWYMYMYPKWTASLEF